jgi:hypothetical protein
MAELLQLVCDEKTTHRTCKIDSASITLALRTIGREACPDLTDY